MASLWTGGAGGGTIVHLAVLGNVFSAGVELGVRDVSQAIAEQIEGQDR